MQIWNSNIQTIQPQLKIINLKLWYTECLTVKFTF